MRTAYWESERGAEIDFIIQRDGQLIPIEVKSADNTRAKSLKVYMDTYKPSYAIKLSAKNFGFEDNKKSFLSMPHFVSELNIAMITLTENVGVIFCIMSITFSWFGTDQFIHFSCLGLRIFKGYHIVAHFQKPVSGCGQLKVFRL